MSTYKEISSVFYSRTGWSDVVGVKANNAGVAAQQTINAQISPYNTALKNVVNALKPYIS